jgi:protoheme IX farnesyltransferase
MLPVVAGERATTAQILSYTVLLVGLSLLLQPVTGLGTFYLVFALALGGWFLLGAIRLRRDISRAMAFFRDSNLYLALLFGAVALDVLV